MQWDRTCINANLRIYKSEGKEADTINREEQLSALIDSYQHLVFSICYKMTADYFASEDLTQETFLSVYRHLGEFDGRYEKAWVCRIATNKCLDYLQSAGRRSIPTEDLGFQSARGPDEGTPSGKGAGAVGESMAAVQQTPESIWLEKEVRATLLSRCRSLKPPYDEIAKAYYYDELDAGEIARQRGAKKKTIQTQIYRARSMLR
ncbi:MAG: sigma-70 family RNA polymerase sigma factor, partial [Lachnospiraceae bacterium]|nr:sigma-70 family RNA polymerase sigma factor [Lachnospiraceae bacterium]